MVVSTYCKTFYVAVWFHRLESNPVRSSATFR